MDFAAAAPVIALKHETNQAEEDEEPIGDYEEPGFTDEENEEEEADQEGRTVTITRGSSSSGSQLMNPNVKIVKVVPLPHARSEVWSYFGFIADDDGEIQDRKKAICKICATTLSYSGNTTNMFTHLKAMHPEATPQKLQPTNKFPRTGRKAPSKRKFLEAIANTGHLAIQYPPSSTAAAPTLNGNSPAAMSNSYIIRVHSTSNGTEQVFEETLSVSPDAVPAIHHVPSSSSSSSVTSPSVICVNKNISSAAGPRAISDTGSSTSSSSHHHYNNSCQSPQQQHHVCNADDITNAIVDMIVKDCRPLCLVDGKGFQALLKLIAPAYQIPDHQRLTPLVKAKYDDLRRELILKGMQGET